MSRPSSRARMRIAPALLAGLLIASSPGCARAPSPPPPDPEPQARHDYVIGIADVLRVTVWKNPDLAAEVPVRPDGKISVPLLDDLQAEGLTALELKEVITQRLSEYISNPDVTVIVKDMNSRRATVVGEVNKPSAILINQDTRVVEAIALAGGFSNFANRKTVKVLRKNGDDWVEYRFNYDAFVAGKDPDSNLVLAPGDTVVVSD